MKLVEITNKQSKDFNKVTDHPVQSWEWGEFRKLTGNKVVTLGLFDKNKLLEGYLLTLHKIPYTNKFVAMFAKGPAPSRAMLKALLEWAKKENVIFIRIEPNVTISNKSGAKMLSLFKEFKMHSGRPFFNKSTYCIDLKKSEEELLKAMHPKTRYNIRVAAKHGVEVFEDNSEEAFGKYLDLMEETTIRQNYFAHTEKYHKLMWQTLMPLGIAHLFKAVYQGKTLATWILFVWKDHLYYPYGASSSEFRNVMAPYAMMWETIKYGKQQKLTTYDLWGSDDKKGYTKFKEGFNPGKVDFLGTWDFPIMRKSYYLYRIIEEIRWKFLKFRGKFIKVSSFR